jgi:hypothetical protein
MRPKFSATIFSGTNFLLGKLCCQPLHDRGRDRARTVEAMTREGGAIEPASGTPQLRDGFVD